MSDIPGRHPGPHRAPQVGARRPCRERARSTRPRRTPSAPTSTSAASRSCPRPDLRLRLEVEEGSKRVVAVGLDYAESTLQVQPFAAPRNSGLWHEIREQIVEQIAPPGRHARPSANGVFGPELRAEVPGRRRVSPARASPASSASTGRAGSSAA